MPPLVCTLKLHGWSTQALPAEDLFEDEYTTTEQFPGGLEGGQGRPSPYLGALILRARLKTPSSVSFCCPHRVPGRELSELLSAYMFCCRTHKQEASKRKQKSRILSEIPKSGHSSSKMSKMGMLDILIDFWGHYARGVQHGIFRTLNCALGFQGSVAGQGDCKGTHDLHPRFPWFSSFPCFP